MKVVIALAVMVVSMMLTGCATTKTEPSSLTGQQPVMNDKGVVVGYQAR